TCSVDPDRQTPPRQWHGRLKTWESRSPPNLLKRETKIHISLNTMKKIQSGRCASAGFFVF
ncbi:hypothetical protein ACG74X_06385, partial [Marivita sp. S0852]|uniref:hypothetical protein n=1 Tax=Marivita sp. S0852 TaxID=3373893 RepID=UPI00398209EC